MSVLLYVSAFNGLSQRVWTTLRGVGHHVNVEFALNDETMLAAAHLARPDLFLCLPPATGPAPIAGAP